MTSRGEVPRAGDRVEVGHSPLLAGLPDLDRAVHAAVRGAAPTVQTLVGPGGTGKTLGLSELAEAHRRAGAVVRHVSGWDGATPAPGTVLLADDAHDLPPRTVNALARAADEGGRLVVAHRPWPCPADLARVDEAAERAGGAVVLRRMDRGEVAARAAALLGRPLPASAVGHLLEQTTGLARFVDVLLRTGRAPDLGGDGAVEAWHEVLRELDAAGRPAREVLLAMALGAPAEVAVLSGTLGLSARAVLAALRDARACGLLTDDGGVVPLVRETLLGSTPARRTRELLHALIDAQIGGGTERAEVARRMATPRLRDDALAQLLADAASEVAEDDPARAAALYAAAQRAGGDPPLLLVRRAECLALAGDVDAALHLADELIAAGGPDAVRAAGVAAAGLVHRGLTARAADVLCWAARADPSAAPSARLTLLMVGRDDSECRQDGQGPVPSLGSGAVELAVTGLQRSFDGDGTAALPHLLQAASMLNAGVRGVLLPEAPSTLAALVAIAAGEPDLTRTVVAEAASAGTGGPLGRPRHHLLLAWVAMLEGSAESALSDVARAREAARGALTPRDELWAQAVTLGVARRSNDLSALVGAWPGAVATLAQQGVDLVSLLPLGEISVAGARLDEERRLAPFLDEAEGLLDRLGRPVLWGTVWHWSGVHRAILAESPASLEPHARALVRAAGSGRVAAVLAEAGRAWLHVLAGKVDPVAVERAGRRLARIGLAWDGARLAGHAAARTVDHRTMVSLLQVARALQGGVAGEGPVPARAAGRDGETAQRVLSERELEIARLVVAGRTYREIAQQLYISARTVEHHVARMRTRLGARTRGELLAHLRGMLGHASPTPG